MSQPLPESLIDRRTAIIARANEAARRLVEVSELLDADLASCSCSGMQCIACRAIAKAERSVGKAVRALVGGAGQMQIENEMAAEIARLRADSPAIVAREGGA